MTQPVGTTKSLTVPTSVLPPALANTVNVARSSLVVLEMTWSLADVGSERYPLA
jgi:hypothetical protein